MLRLSLGGHAMRRRAFITLLGGAVVWPAVTRAQQSEAVRRIGVLMNRTADDPQGQARLAAFHTALCGALVIVVSRLWIKETMLLKKVALAVGLIAIPSLALAQQQQCQ